MLLSVNELTNYVLSAKDGEIGRCRDFLFDDEHWTIRYMVANTGKSVSAATCDGRRRPIWATPPSEIEWTK